MPNVPPPAPTSTFSKYCPAASATLNYVFSAPNPLTAGMKHFPTALSAASLAFKNTAYFAASVNLALDESPFHGDTALSLAAGIACDVLHIGVHVGRTSSEKVALLIKSLATDLLRVGTLNMGEATLNAIAQPFEAVFQMVEQTETNYHYFDDTPSKEGNLYRAIEGNNPRIVQEWSKNVSYDINKMGEGGPSGTVPALFVAAKVPDVKKEVFSALLNNGADPECSFVDPENNYVKLTITEYLERMLPGRVDLLNLIADTIRDTAIQKEDIVEGSEELLVVDWGQAENFFDIGKEDEELPVIEENSTVRVHQAPSVNPPSIEQNMREIAHEEMLDEGPGCELPHQGKELEL